MPKSLTQIRLNGKDEDNKFLEQSRSHSSVCRLVRFIECPYLRSLGPSGYLEHYPASHGVVLITSERYQNEPRMWAGKGNPSWASFSCALIDKEIGWQKGVERKIFT